jgi:hypothetical protein
MTGSSGWRASRTNCFIDFLPRLLFASRIAVRNEKDSSTIAMPRTTNATIGLVSASGSWNLCQPS